jgi:hypothetical protein
MSALVAVTAPKLVVSRQIIHDVTPRFRTRLTRTVRCRRRRLRGSRTCDRSAPPPRSVPCAPDTARRLWRATSPDSRPHRPHSNASRHLRRVQIASQRRRSAPRRASVCRPVRCRRSTVLAHHRENQDLGGANTRRHAEEHLPGVQALNHSVCMPPLASYLCQCTPSISLACDTFRPAGSFRITTPGLSGRR